ncbi:MAG: methyltransferase domain-containing protein [Actinomycetota bacterium]
MTVDEARWSRYGVMARHVAPANEVLLDLVGPTADRVLDVGAGIGTGLDAARDRGWSAVGVDLAASQVAAACRAGHRSAIGDAQELPFAAQTFGAAISNFGVIFAPDPAATAREAYRVLLDDGRFAFTTWLPGGWPGACRAILAEALDNPAKPFATTLGEGDRAVGLLANAGFVDTDAVRSTLTWNFTDLDDAVQTLTTAAGGLRLLRDEAEARGVWEVARSRLRGELAERCEARGDTLVLDDGYVAAVGRRAAG